MVCFFNRHLQMQVDGTGCVLDSHKGCSCNVSSQKEWPSRDPPHEGIQGKGIDRQREVVQADADKLRGAAQEERRHSRTLQNLPPYVQQPGEKCYSTGERG